MDGQGAPRGVAIEVLGPLRVQVGGVHRAIQAPKAGRLLLRLLVAAGRPVATGDLRDDVWPGASPSDSTLRVTVRRLRAVLGDDGAEPRIIRREVGGYLLDRDQVDVDADRFRALVASARALVGDPDAAIARYQEALALWRGTPYDDLPFADVEREMLVSERERAVEERLSLAVASGAGGGRGGELIGELEAAVADQPFREHRTASLMVALYRSGRQADALAAYRRLETLLREDLGLSPGADLRDLELRVVTQDPSLLDRRAVPGAPASDTPRSAATAAVALARRGLFDPAARLVGDAVVRARASAAGDLAACLVDQARILGPAGNPAAAVAAADEAIALAREAGDAETLGQAAMVRFGFGASLEDTLVVNLLEPLDLLPPESPVRVELLCAAMHQLALTGTPGDAEPLVREASATADRLDDPRARAVAAIGEAVLSGLRGEAPASTSRRAAAAVEAAEAAGEPRLVVTALHAEVRDLVAVGDIDGVEQLLGRFGEAADRALVPFALVRRRLIRTCVDLARGDLAEVDAQIEQTIADGARLGVVTAGGSSLAQWLLVQVERAQYEPVVSVLSGRSPRTQIEEVTLALALAELGRSDEALASLDRASGGDGPVGSARLVIAMLAAEAAVLAGSPLVGTFLDVIDPHGGRSAVMSYATMTLGPFDRVRGLAALADGRAGEAVDLLRAAVVGAGSASLWRLRSMVGLAAALVARRQPGDLDEAFGLLGEVASSPQLQDGARDSARLRAQHAAASALLDAHRRDGGSI